MNVLGKCFELIKCYFCGNANLILACDFAEFVALCKVIFWKIHIPVRTLLNFCRGMSQPVNWYHNWDMWSDMWQTCEHVRRPCRLWSFFPCALDLRGSIVFFCHGILRLDKYYTLYSLVLSIMMLFKRSFRAVISSWQPAIIAGNSDENRRLLHSRNDTESLDTEQVWPADSYPW